jgi:DNA-binding NtrC family response regulator
MTEELPLVLVVEDHVYMRETLVRVIEMEGFQAVGVGEIPQVLPAIKKYQPAVMILDFELGSRITGVDILRYIKSHPTHHKIPVILHTSESGISTIPEAELADLVLLKPVDPDDLGRFIRRMLKRTNTSAS